MVRIRLFRIGKKNQPSYKIVVTPKENPPQGGNFLDKIGHYNPITKECKIDAEKAKKWLSDGAQPSDTVYNLFVKEGIIEGEKRPKHKKSKKTEEADAVKEEKKDETKDEDKKEEEKEEEKKDEETKDEDEKEEEDKKEEDDKTEKEAVKEEEKKD